MKPKNNQSNLNETKRLINQKYRLPGLEDIFLIVLMNTLGSQRGCHTYAHCHLCTDILLNLPYGVIKPVLLFCLLQQAVTVLRITNHWKEWIRSS